MLSIEGVGNADRDANVLTHSQDAWHCHTGHSEMMERWRGSWPLSLADFSRFVRFTSRGVTWVCKVKFACSPHRFIGDVAISSIWRSPPCCQGGLFHFTFHAALTVWRKSKKCRSYTIRTFGVFALLCACPPKALRCLASHCVRHCVRLQTLNHPIALQGKALRRIRYFPENR